MDILSLFLFTLGAPPKNEYGRGLVPPLPLSTDRVMENRPFASAAPLLQLVPEILGIILSYIDSDSFANLALVNSDCRQIARSAQFTSVCFDYSDATRDLIALLLKEKASRDQSNSVTTPAGAIGPCIRRLTVATNPEWIKHLYNVELSEEFNALEESVRDERLSKATDAYTQYVRDIESILSSRETVPHLELLDWEDKVLLPKSFFDCLPLSSLQHLKLCGCSFKEEFEIEQPSSSALWNLRTLNMGISSEYRDLENWSKSDFDAPGNGLFRWSTSPLCGSILRSCAHSLETLIWDSRAARKFGFGSDPARVPRFAKLRNLAISFNKFEDVATVNALLTPKLSVLSLTYSHDAFVTDALRYRGPIRSLKTLLFSLEKETMDSYFEFLKVNTQICKLTVNGGFGEDDENLCEKMLEGQIIPLVASSFHMITSLRITLPETIRTMPENILGMISKMTTLEQLCLGAGCQGGWKFDWLIDHEAIRNYLSALPMLKKLACTRDSYHPFHSFLHLQNEYENYYEYRRVSRTEMAEDGYDYAFVEERDSYWEILHKSRMTQQAAKYTACMPRLEWIFLGQYPMAVSREEVGGDSQIRVLSKERGECGTLLNRIFGSEELAMD